MEKNENIKVIIIDYLTSNLFSVQRACVSIGLDAVITTDYKELINADAVILPGVGAFKEAMDNLKKLDLIQPIKDFIFSGKPFMGICLGMQLLLTYSEEFGQSEGLNLIKGKVIKFQNNINGQLIKIPHVGWNKIYQPYDDKNYWSNTPFDNISNNEFMYFVHSYYAVPTNHLDILSLTNYKGIEFCSSLQNNNIFAVQFHPEKSCKEGIKIYFNFKKIVENYGEKNVRK